MSSTRAERIVEDLRRVVEEQLVDRAKEAVCETDRYVRNNPWPSIGIAAGVGILIGVLIRRR